MCRVQAQQRFRPRDTRTAPALPHSTLDVPPGVTMHRALLPLTLVIAACCQSTEPVEPLTSAPPSLQVAAAAVAPTQADADAISANIRALHMPYGTLADPGFASSDPTSPQYTTVATYNRTGDAAIWTGHYLAAESFRYAVTQ